MYSSDRAARERTKSISSWRVIEARDPIAGEQRLQISVTYSNGLTRILPAYFTTRESLDRYVSRFIHNGATEQTTPANTE